MWEPQGPPEASDEKKVSSSREKQTVSPSTAHGETVPSLQQNSERLEREQTFRKYEVTADRQGHVETETEQGGKKRKRDNLRNS